MVLIIFSMASDHDTGREMPFEVSIFRNPYNEQLIRHNSLLKMTTLNLRITNNIFFVKKISLPDANIIKEILFMRVKQIQWLEF